MGCAPQARGGGAAIGQAPTPTHPARRSASGVRMVRAAVPRKRTIRAPARGGGSASGGLAALLLPPLAGEGRDGGARRRRAEMARRSDRPPPQPYHAGGGGSASGGGLPLCSFPRLRGKVGMGARAAGARRWRGDRTSRHPSPSGPAQRVGRSDGPRGGAAQTDHPRPRTRGRERIRGAAALLLPPLAGEGRDGGARRRRAEMARRSDKPPPQPVRPGAARRAFGGSARRCRANEPSSPPARGGERIREASCLSR